MLSISRLHFGLLQSMFAHEMKESKERVAEFKDISLPVFRELLRYAALVCAGQWVSTFE